MRVTPILPIAPTARYTARRPPLPLQRNLNNDCDHRSSTDHRKPSNSLYIDLEV